MHPSDDVAQENACTEDPIQEIKRLFVDVTMFQRRILVGQDPVRRAVFLKPHGCAYGLFEINQGLPSNLKVGVFQYKSFPAWVRFSSDTFPYSPDEKSTIGLAIKLFGIPGQKILEDEKEAQTHDFVLQNYDIFFVDTAKDMCEFTYAGVQEHDYNKYLEAHPRTKYILDEMAQEVNSVLQIDYWSVLPYKFGLENSPYHYAKYKVRRVLSSGSASISDKQKKLPNYLHDDLRRQLLSKEISFEFCIQRRTHPDTMPLDEATARWEESVSKPVPVATLRLFLQDIDAPGQAMYGENLSYTPWHALPEHQPVGSLSDARKVVYQASAKLRHERNGVSYVEPIEPQTLDGASQVRT